MRDLAHVTINTALLMAAILRYEHKVLVPEHICCMNPMKRWVGPWPTFFIVKVYRDHVRHDLTWDLFGPWARLQAGLMTCTCHVHVECNEQPLKESGWDSPKHRIYKHLVSSSHNCKLRALVPGHTHDSEELSSILEHPRPTFLRHSRRNTSFTIPRHTLQAVHRTTS